MNNTNRQNEVDQQPPTISTESMTALFATLIIFALFFPFTVSADIVQANGTAQRDQVTIGANHQTIIGWRVSQRSQTVGSSTVSSLQGVFLSDTGEQLAQVQSVLQATRTTQPRVDTLFVLNESINIPLSVIRRAQQNGSRSIAYQRTFIDSQGGASATSSVVFRFSSASLASQLQVTRIQMQFADGRKQGIYSNNDDLYGQALLSYQGTGLLEYTWEVATPVSTKGQPVFFPIASRKQYLLSGGQVTLRSPRLPNQQPGTYLLRLSVSQLDARVELPLIRYVINVKASSNGSAGMFETQILKPTSPLEDAKLLPNTVFSWKPVEGAKAYQLEIHTRPIDDGVNFGIDQEAPITGVLIPAAKTALTINQVSRSYLIPGEQYFWRVIAIDDSGKVIAKSPFRRMTF